jgi:transposase
MASEERIVIGGVDTHKDVHVAAVIDDRGKLLDTEMFFTTASGYADVLRWMRSFGTLVSVGVEGTGSYGAGLARYLAKEDIDVLEVNRPNRQLRRRRGKSDTVDAEAAARAALSGQATPPKSQVGIVESIRVLRVAFTSARRARAQVVLQIGDLVLTAPDELRALLDPLSTEKRMTRCAHFRVGAELSDPLSATKRALRSLARRYGALSAEIVELEASLDELTARANPALRGAKGVGPDVAGMLLVAAGDNPDRIRSEASFAALCGASPIEASSGKIRRHRLSRSGNRQANHALWRIAMVRLGCDPKTQAYAKRRTAEGKTKREILRCLKRYIAREMFHLITDPKAVPQGSELRTTRTDAGLTLHTAASALGTSTVQISQLERAIRHNSDLAHRYERWLSEAV